MNPNSMGGLTRFRRREEDARPADSPFTQNTKRENKTKVKQNKEVYHLGSRCHGTPSPSQFLTKLPFPSPRPYYGEEVSNVVVCGGEVYTQFRSTFVIQKILLR